MAAGAHRELLRVLFEPLGRWVEVDERLLEPYVRLTGMGPAYPWLKLQQLPDSTRGLDLVDAAARARPDRPAAMPRRTAAADRTASRKRAGPHAGGPGSGRRGLAPARGHCSLISTSTPAGRSSFISASTVLSVGSTMSISRWWVRISNWSREVLFTCGERSTS